MEFPVGKSRLKAMSFSQSLTLTFLELSGFVSWIADGPRWITYLGLAAVLLELSWMIVSNFTVRSSADEVEK